MTTSAVSLTQHKVRLFVSATELGNATLVRCAHPRTGHPLAVALAGGRLLEIQKFSEGAEPRTWLLTGGAERVQQDGTLFVATPLDPLFLLLAPLQKMRGSTAENRRESSAGLFRPLSELAGEASNEEEMAAMKLVNTW